MATLQYDLSARYGVADSTLLPTGRESFSYWLYSDNVKDGYILSGSTIPYSLPGYLAPASTSVDTAVGDTVASPITAGVYDAYELYFMCASKDFMYIQTGTSIYESEAMPTDVSEVFQVFNYTENDIPKLFVLYKDTANKLEMCYFTPGYNNGGLQDNWLSTSLVGGAPVYTTFDSNTRPFTIKSDNGFLYLFVDNVVHKIDGREEGGATGTLTPGVLEFPQRYGIKDALDTNGRMYIAIAEEKTISSTGETQRNPGVYIWDRRTTDFSQSNFIQVPGVSVIKRLYRTQSGAIRLLGMSTEGGLVVLQLSGSAFVPLYRGTYDCKFSESRDSVDQVNDTMYFFNKATNDIQMFGPVLGKDVFATILDLTSTYNATNVLHGYNSNDARFFYIQGDTANGYTRGQSTRAAYSSDDVNVSTDEIIFPIRRIPVGSVLNNISVYTAPMEDHRDETAETDLASVKIYLNQSKTPLDTYSVQRIDIESGVFTIDLGVPDVHSVQLSITYSGNPVNRMGFLPTFALFDYSAEDDRVTQTTV